MPEHIERMQMRGITKTFPGVVANSNVDVDLASGEILALLGENGAGKSSLMNVLYGLYAPDQGSISINGREVSIDSPRVAFDLGIGMVHQHFMLIPNMTVTENVALGMCGSGQHPEFALNLNCVRERILEVSRKHGLAVKPDAYIWQLSVGEQQRVELIKTLALGANLLILDEPTAALTPQETDELLALLRHMAQTGCSIIFISHKLHEVRAVSHRIQVLRGGKSVFCGVTSDITDHELAEYMAGRELGQPVIRQETPLNDHKTLILKNLTATSDSGLPALRNLSMDIRKGEIFGIAGVSGNGQRELAQVLNGLRSVDSGTVILDDWNITNHTPQYIINQGMGYIPEDRNHEGTVPRFSVRENLILKDYAGKFSKFGWLLQDKIKRFAQDMIDAFTIRTPGMETACASLSGGNIQKVILAREITRNPKLLVAVYPIRGLDLGATEYVHQQLLESSAKGTAVLLISEELDELMSMCDRIAVIYEGTIMDTLPANKCTKQQLGLLMAGVKEGKEANEGAAA